MAFSNKSDQSAMSEINVTPLVDVMLVLLIVFIVTAPLLMQEVQVKLPKASALNPVKGARTVQLSVSSEGDVYIDKRSVHFDILEPELKKLLAQDAELSVLLFADESVRYGRVAQVMAAVQRVGITKLSFVTVPGND